MNSNDKNIKNVAVYGSCITKDPFTTAFNKDYKERYNCLINDQKHSMISTMQEKIIVDEEDLKILPENADNRFLTKCIKEDLEKTFLDLILEYDIDYLVFDVYFEVERGIVRYNDGTILTKITGFDKTPYYRKLKNVEYITLFDNPEEYFELWKESCDRFFEFFRKNSPDTKIILAQVRSLCEVQRTDKSIYVEPNYIIKYKLNNFLYRKLENYITSNYDVEVLTFDEDCVLKENHRWKKYHVHYNDEYYTNFLKKVDAIVERNDLFETVQKLGEENLRLKEELERYEKEDK